jgi:hypothetical protein
VVGPDDHLVIVSKSSVTQEELRRMVDRVPEALRGRVLVVDGTTLDVKTVRPAKPEWEPMCQCGGPKNHCVGPR